MLFLSLKGKKTKGGADADSKAGAKGVTPGTGGGSNAATGGGLDIADEIDPALLARTQIAELVKTDPRRVGEILSRWADDRTTAETR